MEDWSWSPSNLSPYSPSRPKCSGDTKLEEVTKQCLILLKAFTSPDEACVTKNLRLNIQSSKDENKNYCSKNK